MPLPFLPILGLAAVAAGVAKLSKETKQNMELAEYFNDQAIDLIQEAQNKIQKSQKLAVDAVQKLINQKTKILTGSCSDFVDSFKKIKNMRLKKGPGITEITDFHQDIPDLPTLEQLPKGLSPIAQARLAAVVLPGTPGVSYKESEKAYYDAKANREKAETFSEQTEGICSELNDIRRHATQLQKLLMALDEPFSKLVAFLEKVIMVSGIDYKQYSEYEKIQIHKCVELAQICKIILETPLLSKTNDITPESVKILREGNQVLKKLSAG